MSTPLQVYRVYSFDLARKSVDADFIKAWIALDWDRSLPRDLPAEQRAALNEHLQALFERRGNETQVHGACPSRMVRGESDASGAAS